jgi:hypothetical protein
VIDAPYLWNIPRASVLIALAAWSVVFAGMIGRLRQHVARRR